MTLPKKLQKWNEQPGTVVGAAERQFIDMVHLHASKGVGFGFMQQVIEWIWEEKCEADGLPGSWGPSYFGKLIADLEKQLAEEKKRVQELREEREKK